MDEELQRFEDVLGGHPGDRALPDVEDLLAAAGVGPELLVHDERARKLWIDALVTRPFGDLDQVRSVSVEVELLVLEVRELTSTLRAVHLDEATLTPALERLDWARRRLDQIQRQL